jgi:YVTN family beta-propeller protein
VAVSRGRIRRRRLTAAALVLGVAALGGLSSGIAVGMGSSGKKAEAKQPRAVKHTRVRPAHVQAGPPSSKTRLRYVKTLTGHISPKSIDSSGHGLVFAQNMMYSHTVTVYNTHTRRLVKTISDAVNLSRYGVKGHPGTSRGAPVELAFSPDAKYAYVSNYSMYGAGFGGEGTDDCYQNQFGPSFVYRIDVAKLKIDDAIQVGPVPKYVAVTPDGRFVLVTNWCGYDLSIVSSRLGRQVKTLPLGPYPRGIVVTPGGKTAYIAVMGSTNIARLDLRTWKISWLYGVGSGPRHLVISPKGRWLYATLNGEGTVAKIDLRRGVVVRKVSTGNAPRSMAISPDGKALYVVNYFSNTVSKVRTGDMSVIQTVPTNASPIGITYDAPTRSVWVACYSGSIMVFNDG